MTESNEKAEREAFEAWMRSKHQGIQLHRRDMQGSTLFGEYCSMIVEDQWQTWQARAAIHVEAMKRIAGAPVAQGLTDEAIVDMWNRSYGEVSGLSSRAIAFARAILTQAAPSARQAEPVAWRHSHTLCLYETREDVPLADGDEWAVPLYLAAPSGQAEPVCRTCNGRGTVNRWERVGESDFDEWEDDCPVCGGAGNAPEHVQKLHDQLIATRQDLHNVQMRIVSADIRALLSATPPAAEFTESRT